MDTPHVEQSDINILQLGGDLERPTDDSNSDQTQDAILPTLTAIVEDVSKTLEDSMKPYSTPATDKPEPPPKTAEQIPTKATEQPTEADQKPASKAKPAKENVERTKDDEKLAMYKALAIKFKKELVKSRDELAELRESSQTESNTLRNKVILLEKDLNDERQTHETSVATLEAKIRTLQRQLETIEAELQSTQNEFDNYKVTATKMMQQNSSSLVNSSRTFEDERYKQLKELNDDQRRRIYQLESQLESSSKRNDELSDKSQLLQDDLDKLRDQLKSMSNITEKCKILSKENDNLKSALDQYRSKLKEPQNHQHRDKSLRSKEDTSKPPSLDCSVSQITTAASSTNSPSMIEDSISEGISPCASMKDDSQTNSSSSHDGSTSGYVHIKPAAFEIISRTSDSNDVQSQIDNLTKAYMDSESTNSLLTEQVKALKEEIRRFQRGSERLVLAENLEYLKNVVFKYLSLDSSQTEQKQRLVPVLSTVLKLSPEETAKLNSISVAERPSIASSFFSFH